MSKGRRSRLRADKTHVRFQKENREVCESCKYYFRNHCEKHDIIRYKDEVICHVYMDKDGA